MSRSPSPEPRVACNADQVVLLVAGHWENHVHAVAADLAAILDVPHSHPGLFCCDQCHAEMAALNDGVYSPRLSCRCIQREARSDTMVLFRRAHAAFADGRGAIFSSTGIRPGECIESARHYFAAAGVCAITVYVEVLDAAQGFSTARTSRMAPHYDLFVVYAGQARLTAECIARAMAPLVAGRPFLAPARLGTPPTWILFSGKRLAGKDTLADAIAVHLGAQRLAFADIVRRELAIIKGIPFSDLSNRGTKEHHRHALIQLSIQRRTLSFGYWGAAALASAGARCVVVSDYRYATERAALQTLGARVIVVRVNASDTTRAARGWTPLPIDADESETGLDTAHHDITVANDGPLATAAGAILAALQDAKFAVGAAP